MFWIIGFFIAITIYKIFFAVINSCFRAIFSMLTFFLTILLTKKKAITVFNHRLQQQVLIEKRKARIIPCSLLSVMLISIVFYGFHIKQSNNNLASAVFSVKQDVKKAKYLTQKYIPATKSYEIKSWVDDQTGVIHLHAKGK